MPIKAITFFANNKKLFFPWFITTLIVVMGNVRVVAHVVLLIAIISTKLTIYVTSNIGRIAMVVCHE